MAKDPACLFYWNDWQGGTVTMTRHQKGCYMDLLHAQFNTGHLSLEQIRAVLGVDFDSNWGAIESKFVRDEAGKFFNEKLDNEKERRQKFTKSRAENLASKPEDSSHKGDHMKDHMETHTGDRMEIEIRNRNKNKKSRNPKSDFVGEVEKVITHFNLATGSNLDPFNSTYQKIISPRLKEGRTVEQLNEVIDLKTKEWTGDPKMEKFIRPKTLFSKDNCETYIAEVERIKRGGA